MDLVALFAMIVFGSSWYFLQRTDPGEPLVRLFFATLMGMAVVVGILGLILRLFFEPSP